MTNIKIYKNNKVMLYQQLNRIFATTNINTFINSNADKIIISHAEYVYAESNEDKKKYLDIMNGSKKNIDDEFKNINIMLDRLENSGFNQYKIKGEKYKQIKIKFINAIKKRINYDGLCSLVQKDI